MDKFSPFDAADYLDDEETIAEYLTAAKEDPNPAVLLAAIRDVARARARALGQNPDDPRPDTDTQKPI